MISKLPENRVFRIPLDLGVGGGEGRGRKDTTVCVVKSLNQWTDQRYR